MYAQQTSQVQKAKISPTSDEYVLDQLSQSEEKLLKLLEELDGKDLDEMLNQMEEEEVYYTIPSLNSFQSQYFVFAHTWEI